MKFIKMIARFIFLHLRTELRYKRSKSRFTTCKDLWEIKEEG